MIREILRYLIPYAICGFVAGVTSAHLGYCYKNWQFWAISAWFYAVTRVLLWLKDGILEALSE